MKYEDNYQSWEEFFSHHLNRRKPKNGGQVQDIVLYDTDENSLTERERFIFILITVKYEIKHNMLTEEMKDELDYYFDVFERNVFEDVLGEDEEEQIMNDLRWCYEQVFGNE